MTDVQRTAIVTGCGKSIGLGAATARILAERGCAVVVTDLDVGGVKNEKESADHAMVPEWRGLPQLCEELVELGGEAMWATGNVANSDDVNRIIGEAMGRFGRIDILVNNAAAPHGSYIGDIEEVPLEAWDQVFDVNVRSHFIVCKAITPIMRAQQFGRIVNISSTAGKYGKAHQALYCASKAAVIGFTRSLAVDLAPDGITVNAVLPGRMKTSRAISSALQAGATDVEAVMAERGKLVPIGRMADPSEVAAAVAFLASDSASFITAQSVMVDGAEHPIA